MCVHVCACVCASVCACVRACVYVYMCVCVFMAVHLLTTIPSYSTLLPQSHRQHQELQDHLHQRPVLHHSKEEVSLSPGTSSGVRPYSNQKQAARREDLPAVPHPCGPQFSGQQTKRFGGGKGAVAWQCQTGLLYFELLRTHKKQLKEAETMY